MRGNFSVYAFQVICYMLVGRDCSNGKRLLSLIAIIKVRNIDVNGNIEVLILWKYQISMKILEKS